MRRTRMLVEGLIGGSIGYAATVLIVAALDVAGGRALFHTPSVLGQIVIGGFGEPTPGIVSSGPVLAYNGLHFLVFVAIGMVVSWLVYEVELHPVLWYGAFFAILSIVLIGSMVLAVVTAPYGGPVRVGALIAANAVGIVGVLIYLHRAHPTIEKKIEEHGDPEYEPDS